MTVAAEVAVAAIPVRTPFFFFVRGVSAAAGSVVAVAVGACGVLESAKGCWRTMPGSSAAVRGSAAGGAGGRIPATKREERNPPLIASENKLLFDDIK